MQQRLQELEPLADLLKVTYIQVNKCLSGGGGYVPRRPSILLSQYHCERWENNKQVKAVYFYCKRNM